VSAMVGQVDDQIASAVDKLQIDEAANMEVGRKAGITEKVLREEFSRLSQQIADGFENVAGRLDGVEQEMRKLTARQDSQHDNDYWLQVAMEPPQVITGNRAAYHDFQTRMDQLEKALKDTDVATKLRHERSFPICLSDTTQTKMTTEITKGSMKSLLWVSHGSNCLTSSRELTVEKLRHELKRTEKLPELIVLAMKHGASAAAAELKGLTNVIWLSADTTSKKHYQDNCESANSSCAKLSQWSSLGSCNEDHQGRSTEVDEIIRRSCCRLQQCHQYTSATLESTF